MTEFFLGLVLFQTRNSLICPVADAEHSGFLYGKQIHHGEDVISLQTSSRIAHLVQHSKRNLENKRKGRHENAAFAITFLEYVIVLFVTQYSRIHFLFVDIETNSCRFYDELFIPWFDHAMQPCDSVQIRYC